MAVFIIVGNSLPDAKSQACQPNPNAGIVGYQNVRVALEILLTCLRTWALCWRVTLCGEDHDKVAKLQYKNKGSD